MSEDFELFTCPVCSGFTALIDSPMAELSDAFSGYKQCMECGTSSDEEGFTPVTPEDLS